MRYFNLLTLTLLTAASLSANAALAGHEGHHHGGGNHNSSNKSFQPKNSCVNKAITGTRGGMGFIADPALHGKKRNHPSSNVTKITDPVRPHRGPRNITGGGQTPTTITLEASLIAIPSSPTRVAPMVRDHGATKPVVAPPTRRRNGAITTGDGSLGIGDGISIIQAINPFADKSFQAPLQPGVRDHRTSGPRGGGHGKTGGSEPFHVNTTGPANRRP